MKVLEKETLFRKLKRFSLLGTTFGSITIITIYYILILFDRYIKNDGDNEKKKEAGKNVLNNVKNQEKYTTIVL